MASQVVPEFNQLSKEEIELKKRRQDRILGGLEDIKIAENYKSFIREYFDENDIEKVRLTLFYSKVTVFVTFIVVRDSYDNSKRFIFEKVTAGWFKEKNKSIEVTVYDDEDTVFVKFYAEKFNKDIAKIIKYLIKVAKAVKKQVKKDEICPSCPLDIYIPKIKW